MEPWESRNALQKLIDGAALHGRDEHGKPVIWTDKAGHGVSVAALKGVLNAILVNFPNMFPSLATIAGRCGQKPRTVQRAIEVLQAQEILAVDQTRNSRGAKQNRYSILTTKLAYLGEDSRMPLFKQPKTEKPTRPQDKPMRPGDIVLAPCEHSPSAPGGALRSRRRAIEDQRTCGARIFSWEERGEIVRHAERAVKFIGTPRGDQAKLLVTVGVWLLDGILPPADFEECLESVKRRRPDDKFAYFWGCLKNKLSELRENQESLVEETILPSKVAP